MNYASDALWWVLTDPHVRALASLLTAPPPWLNAREISIRRLLGPHGFRYLMALDKQPQPLHDALFTHLNRSENPALGCYAESLLAFWLAHAPHCQLIAQNVAIQDSRTLGALDFIALIEGAPTHLELTCKYYGARASDSPFVGLNPCDTLFAKAQKITAQLNLIQHPLAKDWLLEHGLSEIESCCVIRGNLFANFDCKAPLNPRAWQGAYGDFAETNDSFSIFLPRLAWLAPARLSPDQLQAMLFRQPQSGIKAQLALRDGIWHETQRALVHQDSSEAMLY